MLTLPMTLPARPVLIAIAPLLACCLQAAEVCPRPPAGGAVAAPPELSSSRGKLHVAFAFRSEIDDNGLTRYCYISGGNSESPTLRVKPGDEVVLELKNELPPAPEASPAHAHAGNLCGAAVMTSVSTNLHFHGLEIPPVCHQDEVIHTSIAPSAPAFEYRFRIPRSQPPGLYWYHPHPHGFSEAQVLGGASGALIVEGIERTKPQVRGLPERILVFRDQANPVAQYRRRHSGDADDNAGKDLSLNFVPVQAPLFRPAVLRVPAGRREFWRVLNAAADTYFDLELDSARTGGLAAHTLELIAIDGVPVSAAATAERRDHILIAPGARAEFIVTTPAAGALAHLSTRRYDTGPDGAANPGHIIANVISAGEPAADAGIASATGPRFVGLADLHPAQTRRFYFSEDLTDPAKPRYFITAEGQAPHVFDMNSPTPDVTVRQGTIEDWIVENRAREAHVFHIHQLHFQLMERDGSGPAEAILRDTVELPPWGGKGDGKGAYPSVRLRMDFRSPQIVGTFLFHCHILEHEDAGMMGSVQVLPR